jgi:hypothetical protein
MATDCSELETRELPEPSGNSDSANDMIIPFAANLPLQTTLRHN